MRSPRRENERDFIFSLLVAELLLIAPDAVNKGLALVFFVFLFRVFLRKAWVAGAATAAMLTVLFSTGSNAIVLCASLILLLLRGRITVRHRRFVHHIRVAIVPCGHRSLGLVRAEWGLRAPRRPGSNPTQLSMRDSRASTIRVVPAVRLIVCSGPAGLPLSVIEQAREVL